MNPVQKISIADQVVENIKKSIVEGEFEVGKKLPSEQALCSSLGVSRSTLREAFRVLQTMGYVELKPGRGAFVKSRKPNEINEVRDWFKENAPKLNDFIEVRQAIEVLAVKIAVERGTDEDFRELIDINNGFLNAIKNADVQDIADKDELFHRKIVAMSYNLLLIRLNDLVSEAFQKYRSISFTVRKNAESAIGPHQEIITALQLRDRTFAVKSIEHHLNMVREDMEAVLGHS